LAEEIIDPGAAIGEAAGAAFQAAMESGSSPEQAFEAAGDAVGDAAQDMGAPPPGEEQAGGPGVEDMAATASVLSEAMDQSAAVGSVEGLETSEEAGGDTPDMDVDVV